MVHSPHSTREPPQTLSRGSATSFCAAFQKSLDAVIDCARDNSQEVRDRIQASLLSMAQKDFGLVLDTICRYLMENKGTGSTPAHQRVTLFKALKSIALAYDEHLGDKIILDLVVCSTIDMTAQMEINNPWQLAAAALCVDLMCINPTVAVPHVISIIPGTKLPHWFVMRTLCEAAQERPLRFMPHMRECLAKVLPILGMAKQDNIRVVFADALASFADAVSQLENLPELSPRASGAAQFQAADFHDGMYTAMSLLMNEWVAARELRVRTSVTMALGKLSLVVDADRLGEKLPMLVKLLTQGIVREKPGDALPALSGMTSFIQGAVSKVNTQLTPHVEAIWQSVFKCIVMFHAIKPDQQCMLLKNHQELMRSIEALTQGAPDIILNFIQKTLDPKFGAKDATAKCAALGTLQHMVQTKTLDEKLEPLKNNVIAIVRTALDEKDLRVQKATIQTISALGRAAENNYLACEGGESLIQFVIDTAATPPHIAAEWMKKNQKLYEQGAVGPGELLGLAKSVITLFISTQPNLDVVLWPFILETLGQTKTKPELLNVFVLICNAVVEIGKRLGNTHDFYFDFEKKVNVPRPEGLVAMFLPFAAQSTQIGGDTAVTVFGAMETIAALLDEPMKRAHDGTTPLGSLWLGTVPELREYTQSKEFTQPDFEEACLVLLKKSVTCKKEEAWTQAVVASLLSQLGQWCPPTLPPEWVKERYDMKRIALCMCGLALSKVNLKSFVGDSLNTLVELTDHTNEPQRLGLSQGCGHVSVNHTDAVLEKLNRVAKPPRQSGGGGMFGKKPAAGPGPDRDYGELSRATVLLAFGQTARRTPQQLLTSRLETHVVPVYLELVAAAKHPIVKEAALVGLQDIATALRKCADFNFVSKPNVMMAAVAQMQVDSAAGVDAHAFRALHEGTKALIQTVHVAPQCDAELTARLKQVTAAGFTKLWADATDLRPKEENSPERAKGKDKPEAPKEPLPESALQKQIGLLGVAMLESAPDLSAAVIDLCCHLAPFIRSPHEHERERSLRAFAVLAKQFGKQLDRRGDTLTPVQKGPVELGGGEMPAASPPCAEDAKKKEKEKPKPKKGEKGPPAPVADELPGELSLGVFFARLVPRLADSARKVRSEAADGIQLCLKLWMLTYGESGCAEAIGVVKGLGPRLDYRDEADMVGVIKDVTAALCGILPSGGKELALLIDELIVRGLIDSVVDAAVAACATLSILFRQLAKDAKPAPLLNDDEVRLFATKLMLALGAITQADGSAREGREDTHRGILLALKALCKNRPSVIFEHILTYPVPHAVNIQKAVQTLANDTGLSRLLAAHCLDVLLNGQLFEEVYSSGAKNLSVCQKVISAACTAGEVCETAKGADVARALQAPLLSGLLLLQAAAHEAPRVHLNPEQLKAHKELHKDKLPEPVNLTRTALKSFCRAVYSDTLNERCEKLVWEQLAAKDDFPDGCSQLISFVVHDSHPEGDLKTEADDEGRFELKPTTSCPIVEELYDFMRHYVQKVYDCHRWCSMAMLGQLLYHCKGSDTILQGIVQALLSRAGIDEKNHIKLQSVRGFGHVPCHPYKATKHFIAPVISSLIACCSDPSLDVCLISMATLEDFIQRINCKNELSAVVVNICIRTKACLDLDDNRIRSAGCTLFGVMTKLSVEGQIDYGVFESSLHSHLAGILVHVNDADQKTRNNSKVALHEMVGWLNHQPPSKKARDHMARLFAKEHMAPTKQTNYDEFANEFSKVWVRHYDHLINDLLVALVGYFGSKWAPVRSAAAIFCGTLLRHLSDADQARSNLESTCSGLMRLMRKDPDAETRTKAAKALGMLGDMQ